MKGKFFSKQKAKG